MDNEYNEAIGREQLRLVMQQVPAMQAASLVVAFFLSYAAWGIVSGANILAFVLPVSAVAAGRVVLYMRFLKVRNEPFVAGDWKSAYLGLALLSGIVWGSSAFLILPRGNPWILALFVLVLASMSASTTVSHSSVKWGPIAWIVPAMLPYAVRCWMDGGEQENILACLIVLYVIVMLLYSHKHHLSIATSIALRFENMKLLEYVRASESRYRGLYEKTPAMLHSIDRTGRIISVSDQWLAILGYAREEVLGHRSVEFLTEESRRFATDIVLPEFMRTGQCKDVEYRFVKKNGEVIDTLLSATSEGDAEGNVVRSLAVIVDITGRKRMDEELRRSENLFVTVFRASPVCISLSRFSDGEFLDINDAFLRLFGYDREEVVGSNSLMLNIWANSDDRTRMVETLRKSGRSDGFETTFRTKSGEIRNMIIISEVVDVAGEQYILGLSHDITDRKRAEQEKDKLQDQLLQAMKMEAVGRLAGGVAHDFNNLMTVIMGYSELMLQKIGKDSPLHGQAEEIKRAGERAASLTQQLLAFSRKQIIQPKVLDLNILITDLSKMLPRLIGEDIEIQVTTGNALGAVKIDPGQFQQILMNLSVNARDAMPKGGKLLIETANVDLDEGYRGLHPYVTPGGYVMLSVSDTGTGMSDEVKLHIFEPFFTTKPKGTGTGLGLSTIYGAVKQSGGHIEVYSEVGMGTTFKIYLPRVEEEAAKPVKADRPHDFPGGTETVLLVEDEEIVRDLCARILGDIGYKVLKARDGADAIRLALECGDRIDLLLTDVVMPGMNGAELASRLVPHHPEMKALFTSGYTDQAIVHHGVLDKGVAFIGKPYSSADLAMKVREVLDKTG